ncbi:MAG TPA: oxygen-independent coproporphyrinogen III oxidase [Erythrobacter sp.]|nr:oxygen-independent coproporphyrinogen III oxidase [Erythrobacter sp.]
MTWPYHPELLATPVPRYTSFPTAAEFGPLDGAAFTRELGHYKGELSLYVHIPFCEKICHYCGCNTAAAGRRQRLEAYLDALRHEIALVADRLPPDVSISRLSFGGGSPNAVTPLDFARLLGYLTVHFRLASPEISIELDPRAMSRDWAEVVASSGIGRASLGVQTFAPDAQNAIGRVQPYALIEQTVSWLREAGVTSLNLDLMYGLPGQRWPDLEDTLSRSLALGADRIALFGYAHVPHLIPRQRAIPDNDLPGMQARFEMAERGFEYLTTRGYVPIGFDHFARPTDPLAIAASEGKLRRNFQGFTDDPAPALLGLGASAISSFPGLLAQTEKNTGRYRMLLSQDHLPVAHGKVRSAEDRYRGAVIERLLCDGRARLGTRLLHENRRALQPFIDRGLADMRDDTLTILPQGLPYSRTIAALFDPYRQDSQRRFSSAV